MAAHEVKEAQEPIAQGLEDVQRHITELVHWQGNSKATEVATYLSSGGVERLPVLSFLEKHAKDQDKCVSLELPETEREITTADILCGWAGVSPALARVLKVYVEQPTSNDDAVAFKKQSTVFVPSR